MNLDEIKRANPGFINRRVKRLERRMDKLTKRFIEDGRGSETAAETWLKTDQLAEEWQDVRGELDNIQREIHLRTGQYLTLCPKGFGPRAIDRMGFRKAHPSLR